MEIISTENGRDLASVGQVGWTVELWISDPGGTLQDLWTALGNVHFKQRGLHS